MILRNELCELLLFKKRKKNPKKFSEFLKKNFETKKNNSKKKTQNTKRKKIWILI